MGKAERGRRPRTVPGAGRPSVTRASFLLPGRPAFRAPAPSARRRFLPCLLTAPLGFQAVAARVSTS